MGGGFGLFLLFLGPHCYIHIILMGGYGRDMGEPARKVHDLYVRGICQTSRMVTSLETELIIKCLEKRRMKILQQFTNFHQF